MPEVQDIIAEVKQLDEKIGGIGNMVREYRAAVDKEAEEIKALGEATAETKETLAKFEVSFKRLDDLNERLTAAEKRQEQAAEEAKEAEGKHQEQLDRIEIALKRAPRGNGQDRAEYKRRVNHWCRAVVDAHIRGEPNLTQDQRKALEDTAAEWKALAVSNDTQAGYLAPVEFVQEIIKGETEISAMRPLIRVRQTSQKSLQVPKRTGQFGAIWVAEQGERSETQGLTYGLEEISTHELYALIDVTEQMLEDNFFDMQSELRTESTEQFAVSEGAAVVSGTATGQPEGFLSNADVQSTNSGSAATIADATGQANGIIDLYHGIKTAYAVRGTWVLNRQTLGSVRKLKDNDNNYIWQPGLATLRPNTILDAPYVEVPDMPNEGANTFPIAFGDWRRAYTLVDRVQMTMLRDPYTQATAGKIRFIFRKRVGGQVVLAEAISKLKCAA